MSTPATHHSNNSSDEPKWSLPTIKTFSKIGSWLEPKLTFLCKRGGKEEADPAEFQNRPCATDGWLRFPPFHPERDGVGTERKPPTTVQVSHHCSCIDCTMPSHCWNCASSHCSHCSQSVVGPAAPNNPTLLDSHWHHHHWIPSQSTPQPTSIRQEG